MRVRMPPMALPLALALLLSLGIGPNSLLAIFAILVLLIGFALLWRPGETPILIFLFFYQWLQASARIFHANFKDVDVADLSYGGGQVSLASMLSLIAVLVLAAGLRIGIGSWRPIDGQMCRNMVLTHNTRTWFKLYALAWIGASAALLLARYVPGLSQPLLAAAQLKWAFFWILAYATFVGPNVERKYLLFAFLLELALGFGSYFSDFKAVFFITFLAIVAAGTRISGRRLLSLAVLAGCLLTLAVVWTAVKKEYRLILSGGELVQIVTLNYGDRITDLAILVADIKAEQLADAADQTFNRLGYVDFFAIVLDKVPSVKPHEYGAIWLDAILRPFMPRALFPEKSAIHDSERTNYYTDLGVASYDRGTSISIGYIGETYIDFGFMGMMVVIFLYGLFLGRVYRWFVRRRGLLGMAFVTTIFYVAVPLETSITKLTGGLIVSIVVAFLVARYAVPSFFPWLLVGQRKIRLQSV